MNNGSPERHQTRMNNATPKLQVITYFNLTRGTVLGAVIPISDENICSGGVVEAGIEEEIRGEEVTGG